MRIYNTLTRKKEEFKPINANAVSMYVCGPTVYNYFHIGNARPFLFYDVVRSYLEYKGYDVTYVQNFTDIDDRIINTANVEGVEPEEISERYIAEYFTDAHALGIRDADVHPKVSDHIDEIIQAIQSLINSGHAYESEGDVYFAVSSFPSYGKLSNQSIDELVAGAKNEAMESKRDPLDFALWKKKKDGEPYWESPFSQGRPGWHIECSVMSAKHLGSSIDIHGGGLDLIFPHHENEVAQSESLSGASFANYWMHNNLVNIDNEKMSKSLGNFKNVRDIILDVDPESLRMFILSSHYRSPINFSEDTLKQAAAGIERLYAARDNAEYNMRLAQSAVDNQGDGLAKDMEALLLVFESHMDDDFNTANAITALFEMAKTLNTKAVKGADSASIRQALEIYTKTAGILGLLTKKKQMLDIEIEELINERQIARKNKDYAKGDMIRATLLEMGIALEDTREGVKWRRV
ncbi:MAG: cysteine--tRNA ligase [Eubacteriaceae bacterium]|nr:cysteine--tRNA ligase [Eubacteriaceae bacterium]